MSYLTMTGVLENVLTTQARVDRKTGEVIQPRHQIQLQCESPLENGEKRLELQTLTVADRSAYDALVGKPVSVAVGVFINGNRLQFFVPKSSTGQPPPRTDAGQR